MRSQLMALADDTDMTRCLISAALSSTLRRSEGADFDHFTKAAWAESAAAIASAALAAAARVTTPPVVGLRRS
jgi:hypothetical protein